MWLRRKRQCRRSADEQRPRQRRQLLSPAVQWDDERGRPIYKRKTANRRCIQSPEEEEKSIALSPEQSATDQGFNDDPTPAGSVRNTTNQDDEHRSGFTPHDRRRRAVFGSKKGTKIIDPDDLFTYYDRFPSANEEDDDDTAFLNSKPDEEASSQHSSTSTATTTTTAQESAHKPSTRNNFDQAVTATATEDSVVENEQKDTETLVSSSEEESESLEEEEQGELKPVVSQLEKSEFDFDETTDEEERSTKQPSSGTELDAARAYFRKLDASPLVVESSLELPQQQPARVVRTRRRAHTNATMQATYTKYQGTCQEAGVQPMSVENFIKHRDQFSETVLYEGFLDE